MYFIDMLPVFKFHETPHIRRGTCGIFLSINRRLTRAETYINLKINFLFVFFSKIYPVLDFQNLIIIEIYTNLFMLVKYSLLSSFTITMNIIRHHVELLILYW